MIKNARILLFVIFLFLTSVFGVIYGSAKLTSAQVIVKAIPVPIATTTPTSNLVASTPTPSLAPTPVYTGFCLNVPVLMYHHVEPWSIAKVKNHTSLDVDNEVFDQQMNYIASHGYHSISAEDLVNALLSHTVLPSKSIVVTLDDGYQDVYDYAFSTLKKYGIKATLMVPTGLLGVNASTNSYYTWSQLSEMLSSGLISVGNHTFSHYAMGSQAEEKDRFEVSTAENQLQEKFGKKITIFAYPYGTNANSLKEENIVKENGINGAFSTINGTYQCDSFILSLHRTRIGSVPFPYFGIY